MSFLDRRWCEVELDWFIERRGGNSMWGFSRKEKTKQLCATVKSHFQFHWNPPIYFKFAKIFLMLVLKWDESKKYKPFTRWHASSVTRSRAIRGQFCSESYDENLLPTEKMQYSVVLFHSTIYPRRGSSECVCEVMCFLFQVHEYLRSKLCSLYENDCIFDKFECCWNGSDRYASSLLHRKALLADSFVESVLI